MNCLAPRPRPGVIPNPSVLNANDWFRGPDLSQGARRPVALYFKLMATGSGPFGGLDTGCIVGRERTEGWGHPMEISTFRKWLAERGCTFDRHASGHGTHGIASVTAHREGRKAVIPLVGSRKRLDPRQVKEIVESLGLDPSELPGEKSRA